MKNDQKNTEVLVKSIVLALATILSFSAFSAIDLLSINTTKFVDLDINKVHDEDVLNEKLGNAPRFAIEKEVSIDAYDNSWQKVGDQYISRHRIIATNAVSLNFAFDFKMSQNSKVKIYATNFLESIRTLTKKDNNPDGKYWTPIIESDDVIVELSVPEKEMGQFKFKIIQVNQGYRKFGQRTSKSGSCNVDVACNESQGWEAEVNSVAVISTGGSTFCTGFMVNNTENDKAPLFMTAKHCRIRSSNASSLVAYWNYQSSQCGGSRDGKKKQFSSGAQFLSASTKSDFTLVKFNRRPNPSWNVNYAGWDRTGIDATEATAIHHPSTDEKSISFEYQPTTVTSYLGEQIPGDATHVRVEDWDVGTTEPGSSGSPLFDQNHRVIGQLHGGYASCTSQTSDWYGRIYTSWEGDGSPDTRLKDWLDPNNTGKTFVDTL
jgi:lysyl endopeptidase